MTDHLGQSKVKLKKLCLYIKIQSQLVKKKKALHTGERGHVCCTLWHSQLELQKYLDRFFGGVCMRVQYVCCCMTYNIKPEKMV